MTRTTNIKQGKDKLAESVAAYHNLSRREAKGSLSQALREANLASLGQEEQDLEWRLKLKPYFKEIMQERKAVWQNSSIPFFQNVWPVFETFAIYLARSSKVEYYRLKDYFKDDWKKAGGFVAKTFTLCKYTALVGLGIISCVPAVSVAVAIPASVWTAITAVNSGSKDFSVMQNLSGIVFGAVAGTVLGGIPVIGPGMAAGLVNGTIAGMKKVAGKGYVLGQVTAMSLLGLSRGAVPVFGLATSLLKLERYKSKQQTSEFSDYLEKHTSFKEIMQGRKAAWQNSSIPFFKDVWPVFETFAIYLVRSSKDGYDRLKDCFKDDWRKTEGFVAKTFTLCKYTALVSLGVISCVPVVGVAVSIPASIWTAITAVNSDSKDFSVMQNISGIVFGAVAGTVLGAIPVIGPGMAAGLVNGTIAGVKGVVRADLAELGVHNNGYLLDQVANMILLGLTRGAVPVFGLAISLIKPEQYEPEEEAPQVRNAIKTKIKQEAQIELVAAKKILGQHEEALNAGRALKEQGVVHDDSPSLVSRVVSGVKSIFTGSKNPGKGM